MTLHVTYVTSSQPSAYLVGSVPEFTTGSVWTGAAGTGTPTGPTWTELCPGRAGPATTVSVPEESLINIS